MLLSSQVAVNAHGNNLPARICELRIASERHAGPRPPVALPELMTHAAIDIFIGMHHLRLVLHQAEVMPMFSDAQGSFPVFFSLSLSALLSTSFRRSQKGDPRQAGAKHRSATTHCTDKHCCGPYLTAVLGGSVQYIHNPTESHAQQGRARNNAPAIRGCSGQLQCHSLEVAPSKHSGCAQYPPQSGTPGIARRPCRSLSVG